jgi:phytoene dehydrogenase-like protein
METYDAIFIGSGHNALVTAAYLARAGWRVLVLEKNDRPGGLVRTEELTLPGFLHDVYSSAHPLFLTGAAFAELGPELIARGLNYLNTDLPTGVSLPDGRTAVFSTNMEANIAEANRLAPGDGDAWASLLGEFSQYAGPIFGLFGLDLASPQAAPLIQQLMLGAEGPLPAPFAADFFRTARDLLESRFQSEVWRALLAPWVMHLGRGPDEANSAFWVPLTFMAAQAAGMPTPQGGSEMLARSLVRLISDHGGVFYNNRLVTRIETKDGRATTVHTADGEQYTATRTIIATTTPDQLYLKLLADAEGIPAPLKQQAARYRYGLGCLQIHLALSEPPRYADERLRRVGQPHLTTGLDGVSRAVNEATRRLLPAEPTISFDSATQIDPSRAPAGQAVARLQMLDVPFQPRGDAAGKLDVGDGSWTADLKNRFADRVIALASQHIPNLQSAILARAIISPADLPRFNPNLGQGDPYGGSHQLAQSYLFRPLPSQPSHRTAIPNLYMLGAATWPGHGINGGSGYIVAKQLLSDQS